jgi:uncharacterized protein YndB with AHSA1/START domain
MPDILLTEEYPHSATKVWRLLTDSKQLARWLMPNDFVAELGREFTMTAKPAPGFDGVIHGKVIEIDPPRRMQWAWRSGSLRTTITFELTPLDTGTRLTLRHEGFEGLSGILPWLLMRGGWKQKLRRRIADSLVDDLRA